MTNAEDQRNSRERKKANGLKRFEAWIKPKWDKPIRDFIKKLKERDYEETD